MSYQRYTSQFKDEAVGQVTEKGRSVQEVAARLGVSSHSLYKWVKAIRPEKDEERADELLDAKKRRAQKTVAEVTRSFLWDGDKPISFWRSTMYVVKDFRTRDSFG